MPNSHVVRGFPRLSDSQLIALCGRLSTMFFGNLAFDNSPGILLPYINSGIPPTVATPLVRMTKVLFDAALDNYSLAYTNSLLGGKPLTAVKDDTRLIITDQFVIPIADQVDFYSFGNASVQLTSGFDVSMSIPHSGFPLQPVFLKVIRHDGGECVISVQLDQFARGYLWFYSLTATGKPIWGGYSSTGSKILVTDLIPGTNYFLYVMALSVGQNNYSPMSVAYPYLAT